MSEIESRSAVEHVCSEATHACRGCAYVGVRADFEGWEGTGDSRSARWIVRCPSCERRDDDQTDWDHRDCAACPEERWA